MRTLIDAAETARLIAQMGEAVTARLADRPAALVGIERGGVWVAERLRAVLPAQLEFGALDISFYRDDFGRVGLPAHMKPSRLPLSLEDRGVVLVDDVLHTGRTARAAVNALFDLGRPLFVVLAVLVDRGGRELPLQADVVGHVVDVPAGARVQVRGPDPLDVQVAGP